MDFSHRLSGATGGGLIPSAAADAAAARNINAAREQPAVALAVLKTVLIPIFRADQDEEILRLSTGAWRGHHEIAFGYSNLYGLCFWSALTANHSIGGSIDAAFFGIAAFDAIEIG